MAQQTSEKLRLPLMILAALCVAGFVWWLSVYTEPTQFAVAQEQESGAESGEAPVLALSAFEQRSAEMADSRVSLERVEVATQIGPMAFLTSLPEGSPYVMRLMPAVSGVTFAGGEVLNVTGTVRTMSPEVLDAWEAEGVITDPTAREIASFGATFLEVDAASVSPPEEAPEGDESDGTEG